MDEAFLDLTGTERLLGDAVTAARAVAGRSARHDRARALRSGSRRSRWSRRSRPTSRSPTVSASSRRARCGRSSRRSPSAHLGRRRGRRKRLDALGIATIGDLAATPDDAARGARRFRRRLARLARGEDEREVEAYREAKSYGEENTFARDVRDARGARGPIRAHADAVAARAPARSRRRPRRHAEAQARAPARRRRYPLVTRSLLRQRPTDDGDAIAARRADAPRTRRPVGAGTARRRLGHAPRPVDGTQLALMLAGRRKPRRSKLNAAVDAIHARFGDGGLKRGTADVRTGRASVGIKRGERD
jgi:DNA polymerase-4